MIFVGDALFPGGNDEAGPQDWRNLHQGARSGGDRDG